MTTLCPSIRNGKEQARPGDTQSVQSVEKGSPRDVMKRSPELTEIKFMLDGIKGVGVSEQDPTQLSHHL